MRILLLERRGSVQNAAVFSYDMSASFINHLRQCRAETLQVRDGHVAQGPPPGHPLRQNSSSRLAIRAARIVLAGGVRMLDLGVAHDQLAVRKERQRPILQAAAVEEERAVRCAAAGNEL